MTKREVRPAGTPNSLAHAIDNAFDEIEGYCKEARFSESDTYIVCAHVRDFLAQRFGAVMLDNPECETILKVLYHSITRKV